MNKDVAYTALIASKLSSFNAQVSSDETRTEWNDFIGKAKQTTVEANLDARFIARGVHLETNWYDIPFTEDLHAIAGANCLVDLLLISTKKPQNVLIVDGLINRLPLYSLLKDTNISFVNNQYLFWWEQHLKNTSENHSFGYTAYSIEELLEIDTPLFDMIFISGHSIFNNFGVLDSITNLLVPEGILSASSTNGFSSLYTELYKTHDMYPLHETLNNADGLTVHLANFLGSTYFIKN